MWILRPPGFDAAKKNPLVFWVHGGPQSAFMDSWSTRWNAQLWAAQGWVIALPNPRGSTGFGQKFVDDVSGDVETGPGVWLGAIGLSAQVVGDLRVSAILYAPLERGPVATGPGLATMLTLPLGPRRAP